MTTRAPTGLTNFWWQTPFTTLHYLIGRLRVWEKMILWTEANVGILWWLRPLHGGWLIAMAIIMLIALDLRCLLGTTLPEWHFCPQNTVLGQTVTISIFQSTLWSHPPMHRRKHRAAAAALHWHRRRNELASKIMLVMTDCDNLINGFIVKVLSVTITSLPSPTTAGENLAPLCQVLNQTWAYKCFLGFGRVIFAATFWECSSNTLTIFWQHL